MKTLDLVNRDKSQINYKITQYPDGQQDIVLEHDWKFPNDFKNAVEIKSRLNNFKDLELIICATQSLKNLGIKEIHLYTPYFIGSRSDRQFERGSCNYTKQVACPIINSLEFESVTVLDPHSASLECCLSNFNPIDNIALVSWAIHNLYGEINTNKFILISPDAGAVKKIEKLAKQLSYNGDIINCSKSRDTDGKITKTVVPYFDLSKDVIIVDDIIDGGKTFIEIGKVIKLRQELHETQTPQNMGKTGKLYLIVTHGIFSKGYKELNRYFDGMFCTNSYREIREKEWDGDKHDLPTGVKQFNIF